MLPLGDSSASITKPEANFIGLVRIVLFSSIGYASGKAYPDELFASLVSLAPRYWVPLFETFSSGVFS